MYICTAGLLLSDCLNWSFVKPSGDKSGRAFHSGMHNCEVRLCWSWRAFVQSLNFISRRFGPELLEMPYSNQRLLNQSTLFGYVAEVP